MIKSEWRNGYHCPFIFCDWCKTEIDLSEDRGVVYEDDDEGIPLTFVHCRCSRTFELHNPKFKGVGWDHITAWMAYLIRNTRYKEVEEAAERLAELCSIP
jgi:hypothetical protein